MYQRVIKRILDIILSGAGIVVLAIPMLIICIAIKIDDPGPAVFTQKRHGIHKKFFNILKFRTMYVDKENADVPTHLLKNPEERITKVGKFLRRTSLDELPQLFNIFGGSMSVVGPRPALWNLYELVEERDKYGANDVKPGLTGWAQINGRDELSNAEKAKFDGEYVEKMSFLFDCKCFFGTIAPVLRHEGVIEGELDNAREQEKKEPVMK